MSFEYTNFENFSQNWGDDTYNSPVPIEQFRAEIKNNKLASEKECVLALIEKSQFLENDRVKIANTAHDIIKKMRTKPSQNHVQALMNEFSLNSSEGLALMCLAEALLRIPDNETRKELIRDKVAFRNWASHLSLDKSAFLNSNTIGLMTAEKILSQHSKNELVETIRKFVKNISEPAIKVATEFSMKMLGEQFISGQTINEALKKAKRLENRGFVFSYDMLGEAAVTLKDAEIYFESYKSAIIEIGKQSVEKNLYAGAGISIKLSALHPRYSRWQIRRVREELYPKVLFLAKLAKQYNIGLNIDAEEADRLEISLDILQRLAFEEGLSNWNGLGFVVQAYQKRSKLVIDWIIKLAEASNKRLMVRLVKGAYWDSEIKKSQMEGLSDYPVYTKKHHTDLSYIVCAKKLLDARKIIFPQFATHNAQTLSTIFHLAGNDFKIGDYEFQCLHGMGESLYDEVVGKNNLDRPCRVYAPVGIHDTLLAYLVRRLLENGANSSFVNKIDNKEIPIEALIEDPLQQTLLDKPIGSANEKIRLPAYIYSSRKNSSGLDLTDEKSICELNLSLIASQRQTISSGIKDKIGNALTILNPCDQNDKVGIAYLSTIEATNKAIAKSAKAFATWQLSNTATRSEFLELAANMLEARTAEIICVTIREAGKTANNALGEIREAVDFLRYYSSEGNAKLNNSAPLGPIACISPWNFPLAIFVGQIAAALMAGNTVIAKPALETPLVAQIAVNILHDAGVPKDVLQLVIGGAEIGEALVKSPLIQGVIFTGSSEVSKKIQTIISGRVGNDGYNIPFIAETGGQNAMVVDSTALTEQVALDVLLSAFDSAGQRCSALRVLYIQEEVAAQTIEMIKGAVEQLSIGSTDRLETDIGPLISHKAMTGIKNHIDFMSKSGLKIWQPQINLSNSNGHFIPPSIIEIPSISVLKKEVFGPVLHIVRYKKGTEQDIIDEINSSGFGLTFGVHSRLDSTVEKFTSGVLAGNYYVNRSIIGATVGVQPFGGRGLSGTGPKAGGPHYLMRLTSTQSAESIQSNGNTLGPIGDYKKWVKSSMLDGISSSLENYIKRSKLGFKTELEGPVGETNTYFLRPKGEIAISAKTPSGFWNMLGAVLATGNTCVIIRSNGISELPKGFPQSVRNVVKWKKNANYFDNTVAAILVEGSPSEIVEISKKVSNLPGKIVQVFGAKSEDINSGKAYNLDLLLEEVSISVNTTAVGGNANLLATT